MDAAHAVQGADSASMDGTELSFHQQVECMKEDAARQEPLVPVIARMLEETVKRNDEQSTGCVLQAFHGRRPSLSASAFVQRVARYSGASPCCFAVGLIYLERMKKQDPGICITHHNYQRLFSVAVMCASKFFDDYYYSNKHWAAVAGIQAAEMNRLELEFLFRMGFSLHMQREEYEWYAEELHSRVSPEDINAAKSLLDGAIWTHTARKSSRSAESETPSRAPEAGIYMHLQEETLEHDALSVEIILQDSSASSQSDEDGFLSANVTPHSSSAPWQHTQAGDCRNISSQHDEYYPEGGVVSVPMQLTVNQPMVFC
jgi:hypothetical protein